MIAEPLPKDPLGVQLCQLFSYRWMTIEGDADNDSKVNWRTVENFPLRPRALWARWRDAGTLVGVRFGNTTQYAVLDIDAGSVYLNRLDDIRAALETIGIVRTIPIRSSWSGGLHLYIPLPETVATFDLATSLKYCLESQGFDLIEGQLETFPNVKSFGKSWLGQFTQYNGHRLPLQPGSGSVMLDDDLQPVGADLSRFFWSFEFGAMAQDMNALSEALRHGRDNHRKRPKIRTHPVEQWRLDLEADISEGWTDKGQTNALLKSISCYGRVFERLEGQELIDYVKRIAVTRPGYSSWCGHQHQIDRKAATWARAAEKYYWPLGTEARRQESAFDFNAERSADAKQRISDAVIQLATSGQLPECITERLKAICKLAHTSAKTLYKYLHLWHPDQWAQRCVIDPIARYSVNREPSDVSPYRELGSAPDKGLHTSPNIAR